MSATRITHLGDGAYATVDYPYPGAVVITANHHDPDQATDQVHMDIATVQRLINFLADSGYKLVAPEPSL